MNVKLFLALLTVADEEKDIVSGLLMLTVVVIFWDNEEV